MSPQELLNVIWLLHGEQFPSDLDPDLVQRVVEGDGYAWEPLDSQARDELVDRCSASGA
jgi:hypothetical protein